MSNVSRGNYYKRKTRLWFEAQGFFVAMTEFTAPMFIRGKVIYVKKDVLGADGIAMKKESNQFIFWNSKGVTTKNSGSSHKSHGRKTFSEFPFPSCVERWVIIWYPRNPIPEISKMSTQVVDAKV